MNGSKGLPGFIRAYRAQIEEGALPQCCDGFCFRTTGVFLFQSLRQLCLKVVMLPVRATLSGQWQVLTGLRMRPDMTVMQQDMHMQCCCSGDVLLPA